MSEIDVYAPKTIVFSFSDHFKNIRFKTLKKIVFKTIGKRNNNDRKTKKMIVFQKNYTVTSLYAPNIL